MSTVRSASAIDRPNETKRLFSEKQYTIYLKIRFIVFLLTGQSNSGVGGYIDEYQNLDGVKQQLLNLVRSVRTVMRG